MGVIETEYTEIRQITKDLLAGKIDKDTAALVLKCYSETGKRIDQLIKVYSLIANHGKSAIRLNSKNLISDGCAIDMGQIDEKIKCPEAGDKLISRCDCLDYSGLSHNIDKCQKCDHFTVTRKQI